MSQVSKEAGSAVIGLDVSDRNCIGVVLDAEGEVVEELKVSTTERGLRTALGHRAPSRVALEVGTHSTWMSELIASLGHEVIIANPRKVRLISHNISKSDRVDAESLARLARLDPKLLSPIRHRTRRSREHLMLIRSRDALVDGCCGDVSVEPCLSRVSVWVPGAALHQTHVEDRPAGLVGVRPAAPSKVTDVLETHRFPRAVALRGCRPTAPC